MKIEAKKYKYNMNKTTGKRPAQPIAADRAAETSTPERPRLHLPKIRVPKINLPKIRLPKIKLPGISLPMLRPPKLKGKRSVYLAALLVGVPVLVLITWLGMNLVHLPVRKPLFTVRDLPQTAAADSNGFALLYDDLIAGEYARTDISDTNLFRNAASLELFLDATRGEYAMAKTLAARDDVKKMIGLYRDIIKKPVFADMAMPVENDMLKVKGLRRDAKRGDRHYHNAACRIKKRAPPSR